MAVQQLLIDQDFIQYVVENMKDKFIFSWDAENTPTTSNTEKAVTIIPALLENRNGDKLIKTNRRHCSTTTPKRETY